MSRRLPALNSLRAFEAGARHLSFTRAAEDLSVTQTAISHQVRQLEDWLGTPLFRRQPRQLQLTEAGRLLYPALAHAFDQIAEAVERVRHVPERRTVTVSVTPTFGSRWLAERLGHFWREHPDIDLRLHHSVHITDLEKEDVDLAVRWGRGDWAGVEIEKLMPAETTPMCSPRLLEGPNALKTPQDLARFPLLHERDYQEWAEWLAAVGAPEVNAQRGPVIDDPNTIIRAALDAQGVMIFPPSMLRQELASGSLVAPFAKMPALQTAYYLVYLPGALRRPKVKAFRDFLVAEMAGPVPA